MKTGLIFLILATACVLANPDVKREPLTPEQMSSLWQSAFEHLMYDTPALTDAQEKLIWEALELGTARVFSPSQPTEQGTTTAAQSLGGLLKRTSDLFSPAQVQKLYSEMGPLQEWFEGAGLAMFMPCNCIFDSDCTAGLGGRCANTAPCQGGNDCDVALCTGRCIYLGSEKTP